MTPTIHRLTTIFIFFFCYRSSKVSEYCFEEVEFDQKYEKNLNQRTLKKAFDKSSVSLGQGSYGLIKQIDWIDDNGKKVKVAVKRIILKKNQKNDSLTREITWLHKTKDSQRILQMYACMETSQIATMVIKNEEKAETINYMTSVIYIVLEKLFGDFDESTNSMSPYAIFKSMNILERAKVYLEYAKGIEEVHSFKIIHSDLKPANMMATDKTLSRIKIIDFGLSNLKGENKIGGSPLYSPIEGFSKPAVILDESFDIYSFGMSIASMELTSPILQTAVIKLYSESSKTKFVSELKRFSIAELSKIESFGTLQDEGDNLTKLVSDCLNYLPDSRPKDRDVIRRLEQIIQGFESSLTPVAVEATEIINEPSASTIDAHNNLLKNNHKQTYAQKKLESVELYLKNNKKQPTNVVLSAHQFAKGGNTVQENQHEISFLWILSAILLAVVAAVVPVGYKLNSGSRE